MVNVVRMPGVRPSVVVVIQVSRAGRLSSFSRPSRPRTSARGAEDLVDAFGGGKVAAADALAAGVAGQHGDQATVGAPAHLGGPAVRLAVQAGLVAGVDQPRIGQVGVLAAEPGVVTRRGLEQHQGAANAAGLCGKSGAWVLGGALGPGAAGPLLPAMPAKNSWWQRIG